MLRQKQFCVTRKRQKWPLVARKTLRSGDFAASWEEASIRVSVLIVEFVQPEMDAIDNEWYLPNRDFSPHLNLRVTEDSP